MVEVDVGDEYVTDCAGRAVILGEAVEQGWQGGAGAAFDEDGAVWAVDEVGGDGVRPILVVEVNGMDFHRVYIILFWQER
jgi:hypothetical protein